MGICLPKTRLASDFLQRSFKIGNTDRDRDRRAVTDVHRAHTVKNIESVLLCEKSEAKRS